MIPKIVSVLLAISGFVMAGEGPLPVALIFVPENIYTSNTAKVTQLCNKIWESGEYNPCPNSEWKHVEKINKTTQTGWVYDVTLAQIRAAFDSEQIARLKEILDGTGVLYIKTYDWRKEMADRGWRLIAEKAGNP